MQRRGFLQGLFGGLTATGLIVAATPKEIEAFAAPLVKDEPLVLDAPMRWQPELGQHLYNERGELVAFVRQVIFQSDMVDVTHSGSAERHYIQARPSIEIHAVGVCSYEQRQGDRFPMLVGNGDFRGNR
jgi:hypothetical protein